MQVTFTSVLLALASGSTLTFAAPLQSEAALSTLNPRFVGGWCGVHVHWAVDSDDRDTWKATGKVTVKDSKGMIMSTATGATEKGKGGDSFAITAKAAGGMPKDLLITLGNPGTAEFEYGTDSWTAPDAGKSDTHCKVGKVDAGDVYGGSKTLDMDCGFTC